MTVSSTTTSVSYTGNGSTTSFAVTFPFLGTGSAAELTVVQRVIATGVESTLSYTTNYTVSGGSGSTGTVTAASAPADTVQWHIRRNTTTTQTVDYVTNDPFPADTHETALDRLAMAGQERDGDIAQTFKYPDTYTGGASATFPEPVANAYVLFNAAGDALTTSSTVAGQSLGADGTASLPFYSFSSDANSGFYRIGADNVGLTLGGTKRVDFATAGTAITGTLTTSGVVSVDDTTDTTSGTSGSIHTDGGVGIAKKLFVGGVTTHGANVVSDTDSTDDLGTTSVRWANLYVDAITTTDNQTIGGNLTVTGNLTINGTTVTNDATNTEVKDPLIELNSGASSNASDLGIIMERGSTGDNAVMLWDESGDFFTVGTTSATADSTGNMTYSFAPFKCSALTATSGTLPGLTSLAMSGGATLTAGFLDEDDMSTDSAVAGVTQQSVKAYVDNNAPENGVKFTFETTTTDTDQGAGKIFLNHATPSSATVLYVDDVEAGGVSVNAWVDTWDDVSNAVARGYVYIAKYGSSNALLVYKVTGAVTSASTYSKVAVTHVVTIGSFADGDSVGLTFVPSGADGSGDLSASNNLSDVASATTSATNLGLGTGDSPQFTGIELGHASDTTITRPSSGDLNIEGNRIYRAGGTDVAVADGGTGASSLTDGGILLGSGTSAVTAMAALSKGSIVVGDGDVDPVALAVGSNNHVLTADSGEASGLKWAAASGGGFTLSSEIATTSGTTADFTSIGSSVKVIHILFEAVSFSGSNDNMQIQIGDSGGIETSAYHSMSATGDNTGFSGTAGFAISMDSQAADTHSGLITLALKDATNNTWCLSGIIADDNQTADTFMSGGSKSLSATLDRVRFHTENGRTLDGGSIAILTSE